jgi:hypothetical protein
MFIVRSTGFAADLFGMLSLGGWLTLSASLARVNGDVEYDI